jgi:superkiller protein 3
MGKLDEAVAAYLKALEIQDDAGPRAQLAAAYARQGKTDEAIAEYEKAAGLDAQDWRSRAILGDLYLQAGNLDKAEARYRAALAIKDDLAGAHYGLGLAAYKRCNLSVMEQEVKAAASHSPGIALYKGALAGVHEAQGRTKEATAIYAELLASPVTDAIAHLLGGDYLLRTGKLDEAAGEFQIVLGTENLPPILAAAAHNALGKVYTAQERLIPAGSEFNLALQAFSAHAEAQAMLGDTSLRGGDAVGALAAYDAAAALLPEYGRQMSADEAALLAVGLEIHRGFALGRQGKQADSAAALDKALSLAQGLAQKTPQWPGARFALALTYSARGEMAQSESEFAAAFQCDKSLIAARARAEADLAKLR